MIGRPRDLAERARELAEKRDRQAEGTGLTWREEHLKATAANYRALANELDHQIARMHSLRHELAATNAAKDLVRALVGDLKAPG